MRPVPILAVQPNWEFFGAAIGSGIGFCVGPFSERGLYEAFGFAVGFGRVGPGTDMLETEISAGLAKGEAQVETAVVGHDAGHGDAEVFVVSDSRLEEGNGVIGCLTGPDLGEGHAGMIVDADMDELPAEAAAMTVAGLVAGDAVADFCETA